MLSPKSFNRKLYGQLRLIITIQKDLSKLDYDNIEEISNKILIQKDIVQSQKGISILAQCFNDVADFHPKKIELLADAFIFLQKFSDPSNYLHLLKNYTVSCIHCREKVRPSFLFFLRTLLLRKAITIDLIINEINLMPLNLNLSTKKSPKQSQPTNDQAETNPSSQNDADDDNDDQNNSDTETPDTNESEFSIENENFIGKLAEFTERDFTKRLFRVVDWFFPEINVSQPLLIQRLRSQLYYDIPNQHNIDLESMNAGYSQLSIAKIIRDDDIDSFTKIVGEFGPTFDYNQKLKLSRFERCVLLTTKPNLIQYAAFFGSVKIFKNLLLNSANIDVVSGSLYSLAEYAVSGGCTEIIRILAQKKLSFFPSFPIAVQFFQSDVFLWLLENFVPRNRDDMESMDVYAAHVNIGMRYRKLYLAHENRKIDDTYDDFYNQNGYGYHINDPIKKVVIRNENKVAFMSEDYSSDGFDNEEEEAAEIVDGDSFAFFNFDIVFESIVNTNNYLALFMLFDHGMDINACCKKTGMTMLHYAVRKGKSFLVDLLLSNDAIDPSLRDKNDQCPIVYAVKYSRAKIFFKMIKAQKVAELLDDHDYIQMACYASFLGLDEVSEYIKSVWTIDLVNLIETDDIKTFADAMSFLPMNFFKDQIETGLIESFKSRRFNYFCILVSRVLNEKDVTMNGIFHYVPKSQSKSLKEREKDFTSLFQLVHYFWRCSSRGTLNYYKSFLENKGERKSMCIRCDNLPQFQPGNLFYFVNEKRCFYVYFKNDPNEVENPKVVIQFPTGENKVKKIKKKKTNNNPTIVIDDKFIDEI